MSIDIFIRRYLKKQSHDVKGVKVEGCECVCPCGTRYFASPPPFGVDDRCPDCGAAPAPGRIGPVEVREYDVPLRFGNLLGGPQTDRVIVRPSRK